MMNWFSVVLNNTCMYAKTENHEGCNVPFHGSFEAVVCGAVEEFDAILTAVCNIINLFII